MSDEEVAIELIKIEAEYCRERNCYASFKHYKDVLKCVKELSFDDKISKIKKLFKDYKSAGDYCEFCKDKLINDIKQVVGE